MSELSFSIIIPTYNEELDIRGTLEAVISLVWSRKEIIVVDDSTDRTPEIVSEYHAYGVKLIKPEKRNGRSEARNIGIHAATGDVLLILNADVLLPNDFLQSIAKFYSQGYHSVSVMNTISNQNQLYARFLEARRNLRISKNVYNRWAKELNGVFWTEGFSVRRDIALKTRLFPSGYEIPLEAGEDARFAEDLRRVGCRGYFAGEIIVPHIAPGTLREFWRIRVGRGAGMPQVRYFLDRWPSWKISVWRYAKVFQRLAKVVTIIPLIYSGYCLAKNMHRNLVIETLRYVWVMIVEEAASTVGEYQSHSKIKAVIRSRYIVSKV